MNFLCFILGAYFGGAAFTWFSAKESFDFGNDPEWQKILAATVIAFGWPRTDRRVALWRFVRCRTQTLEKRMIVMPANATGMFFHCLARETGRLGHLYSPGAERGPWP